MTTVLSAEDLHLSYGPINAVRGCSFHLDQGEIIAVVGANGAGKTTIMRGLSNLLAPKSGTITFLGEPIARRKTSALARAGMLHIPEGRGTIGGLTVLENLRVAFDVRPARARRNVPEACPAANNKCWRSHGRWSIRPASCWSMSPRLGCRRS